MLGILLVYAFAFGLKWFPFAGAYGQQARARIELGIHQERDLPRHAARTRHRRDHDGLLGAGYAGHDGDDHGEDYMILAEAKGLRPSRIFWLYGVRNAILPQVTALALTLGSIAGGSVIVEYIFTYPGMGYLLYQGIVNADYTLIQGIVYFLIVGVALAVLIIDLLYPLIDPRISYQKK